MMHLGPIHNVVHRHSLVLLCMQTQSKKERELARNDSFVSWELSFGSSTANGPLCFFCVGRTCEVKDKWTGILFLRETIFFSYPNTNWSKGTGWKWLGVRLRPQWTMRREWERERRGNQGTHPILIWQGNPFLLSSSWSVRINCLSLFLQELYEPW